MSPKHTEEYHDALWWALQTAADMIEEWEYCGATTQRDYELHREGAIEAAKRIQRMADRYFKRHLAKKRPTHDPYFSQDGKERVNAF